MGGTAHIILSHKTKKLKKRNIVHTEKRLRIKQRCVNSTLLKGEATFVY